MVSLINQVSVEKTSSIVATARTLTLSKATQAGDKLYLFVNTGTTNGSSNPSIIDDITSGGWTTLASVTNNSQGCFLYSNTVSGITKVIWTPAVAVLSSSAVLSLSGYTLIGSSTGSALSGAAVIPSQTINNSGDLIVGIAANGNYNIGTNPVNTVLVGAGASALQLGSYTLAIPNATSSQSITLGTTNPWVSLGASFAAAASGGGGIILNRGQLTALGA